MELITASQIIMPSSPTPSALKHHKLSFPDQIAPSIYVPLIFFYKYDKSKPQVKISQRLRQSLSETLTVFYPLAGTIKENSFVDCDDTGVEFVEARVHARLAPLIQNPNPNMEELKQLVPVDSLSHNDNNILSVKTSYFDCGGVSIGVCLSHKIGDMASFVMFMNAWASSCRGESSRITLPSFDLALHFRPRVSVPSEFDVGVAKKKIVTKRLVFESKKIDKLRQAAAASVNSSPTRVEVVTAFIWRNFIEAKKGVPPRARKTSSFLASHVVNMRSRTVPPVPDHTFGNCFTAAYAVVSSEEEEDDDDMQYVSKLKAAIRAVDDDYIKKAIIENDNFDFQTLDEAGDLLEAGNLCSFTSWWRFPLYDVDFGWGKPDWVCAAQFPYQNLVILMSTPSGDGMEAWVNINPNQDFFQLLQANYTNLLT